MEFSVLDDEQIRRLHKASLEILRTVGVRVPHPEVRRLFPVSRWRAAITRPLRSSHPLELFRGTRSRAGQLYVAAVMLERPSRLPAWLLHRLVRDRRVADNPLDPAR